MPYLPKVGKGMARQRHEVGATVECMSNEALEIARDRELILSGRGQVIRDRRAFCSKRRRKSVSMWHPYGDGRQADALLEVSVLADMPNS